MYCPKCLNAALKISPKGVVDIIVNNKQKDNGRFLYNLERESESEILNNFKVKLEEFLAWYADFQNKEPITHLELCSSAFICDAGCPMAMNQKYSVLGVLLKREEVLKVLEDLGHKHKLEINLEDF